MDASSLVTPNTYQPSWVVDQYCKVNWWWTLREGENFFFKSPSFPTLFPGSVGLTALLRSISNNTKFLFYVQQLSCTAKNDVFCPGELQSQHSSTKPRAQSALQSSYIIPSPSRKQQLARNDHVQIKYLVTQTLIRYDSCLDTIPGTK